AGSVAALPRTKGQTPTGSDPFLAGRGKGARWVRSVAGVKILSVVGNRPQFIKSAPLSAALRAAGIEEISLHTGQHYDPELSQVFYDELGLEEPRYRLDVRESDPHRMVPGIRQAVEHERPDWL